MSLSVSLFLYVFVFVPHDTYRKKRRHRQTDTHTHTQDVERYADNSEHNLGLCKTSKMPHPRLSTPTFFLFLYSTQKIRLSCALQKLGVYFTHFKYSSFWSNKYCAPSTGETTGSVVMSLRQTKACSLTLKHREKQDGERHALSHSNTQRNKTEKDIQSHTQTHIETRRRKIFSLTHSTCTFVRKWISFCTNNYAGN